VSTETLPNSYSGDTHTDTQTDRGIYEVLRTDGIRFHDIDTRFLKDWLWDSNVRMVGCTDKQTDREQVNLISLLLLLLLLLLLFN
jgi:hypothetical protein